MASEATTLQELLVSSLAQTDALAKLLIEKGVITQQEFLAKISEERVTYQRMLNLWGLWLRFSVVLLALSVVALVEGVLLSQFGFGWFLLALAITLYVVKKFARRLLGWER
jgi:hypothetical protein